MKNLKILFGSVAVVLAVFFVYSCNDEVVPTSDTNNMVESRSIKCDGAPMPPPLVIHIDSSGTTCCFKLQFSPIFLSGTPYQIIGFDSGGTTIAPATNGFCVGTLDSLNQLYQV
mgnify:CR=1 FL=1